MPADEEDRVAEDARHNGRKLPPPLRITWGPLSDKNVRQLEKLNAAIFPVKYNEHFYKEAVKAPDGFVRLAYYNDVLVAGVCTRKEPFVESHLALHHAVQDNNNNSDDAETLRSATTHSLYILTLGVLAPYRERGVGHQLLDHVLDHASKSPHCKSVVDVYVHVQVGNDDAVRFYHHHGFSTVETIPAYYKRIQPADCLVLRKPILPQQ